MAILERIRANRAEWRSGTVKHRRRFTSRRTGPCRTFCGHADEGADKKAADLLRSSKTFEDLARENSECRRQASNGQLPAFDEAGM